MSAKNAAGVLAITLLLSATSYSASADAATQANMSSPDSLSLLAASTQQPGVASSLLQKEEPHVHHDKGGHFHHDHEMIVEALQVQISQSTFVV